MKSQIQLSSDVKVDSNGDEYYVVTTDMPITVDLAKSVMLVFHPKEGSKTGTVLIKPRSEGPRHRAPEYKEPELSDDEMDAVCLSEVKKAEERFQDGYVGLGFFLRLWRSEQMPTALEQRKSAVNRLVAAGKLETYAAHDGKEALRAVATLPRVAPVVEARQVL